MTARHLSLLLIVLGLLVVAFAVFADQGGRSVGMHEIPTFIRERVELPSGAPGDRLDRSVDAPGPQSPHPASGG